MRRRMGILVLVPLVAFLALAGLFMVRLGAGDFFGEAALITGEPRNATVVANDNVETYVLAKDEFRAAIEASRSFRDQLYRVYFLRH